MFKQSLTCISCRDLINFLAFKEMFTVGLEESGRKEINTNRPLYNITIYTRRRIFVQTTLFLIATLKQLELVSTPFSLYFTEENIYQNIYCIYIIIYI